MSLRTRNKRVEAYRRHRDALAVGSRVINKTTNQKCTVLGFTTDGKYTIVDIVNDKGIKGMSELKNLDVLALLNL
jgi:hypothetical protein